MPLAGACTGPNLSPKTVHPKGKVRYGNIYHILTKDLSNAITLVHPMGKDKSKCASYILTNCILTADNSPLAKNSVDRPNLSVGLFDDSSFDMTSCELVLSSPQVGSRSNMWAAPGTRAQLAAYGLYACGRFQ